MSERKEARKPENTPKSKRPAYLYGAAILIVALGFILTILTLFVLPKGQTINTNEYQVVYLTNGQMYFGKLQNTEGSYLYMTSPYMPQSTPSGQPANVAGSITRVKNQLWGPEDSIAIRANQVAFWQNLRTDSKIVQAINSTQGQ